MSIVAADTHVHLYPFHRGEWLCDAVAQRMQDGGADIAAICLTERRDCRAFAEASAASEPFPGWARVATPEPGCLVLRKGDALLHLVAGRQIITAERIEVLALTVDMDIADGLPAREVLARVTAAGAVPVLPWAPGKWLGARGKLVATLVEEARAGELLLGDTTLRAIGIPEPSLFRVARRKGIGIAAGSDPLPFDGEETQAGRYLTVWQTTFDLAKPVTSLRRLLLGEGHQSKRIGSRSNPLELAVRLYRNARAKSR